MPLSEIIPKERLSAWERWELASLAPAPGRADATATDALAAERAKAIAEGHAAGYGQGRAQAAAEQAQLATLLASLASCVADHEQRLIDEALDVALVVARQMVGEALSVKREFLLPIVSAALRQLPQNTQRVEIFVNPSDLALVSEYVATETLSDRCRFVPHATIAPGGCRIETEQCEVDATVGSRWKRLLASLGRTGEWIEPA